MSFVSLLEYRNRPILSESYNRTIVYYDSNIIQIVQNVVTSSESFSSTKKYLHCPNCPNPRNFGIISWNYFFKLKFWKLTWEIQIEIQIWRPNWNRFNLMQIKIEIICMLKYWESNTKISQTVKQTTINNKQIKQIWSKRIYNKRLLNHG